MRPQNRTFTVSAWSRKASRARGLPRRASLRPRFGRARLDARIGYGRRGYDHAELLFGSQRGQPPHFLRAQFGHRLRRQFCRQHLEPTPPFWPDSSSSPRSTGSSDASRPAPTAASCECSDAYDESPVAAALLLHAPQKRALYDVSVVTKSFASTRASAACQFATPIRPRPIRDSDRLRTTRLRSRGATFRISARSAAPFPTSAVRSSTTMSILPTTFSQPGRQGGGAPGTGAVVGKGPAAPRSPLSSRRSRASERAAAREFEARSLCKSS